MSPPERTSGERKIDRESGAPLGHAQGRQMPGILVLDAANGVVLANARAGEMMRDVGGARVHAADDFALPPVLVSLVPQLRTRLRERNDTSAAALLTVDICVRACHLVGAAGQHLVLVLERVQRRDAVQQNLERFALSPRECDVVMLVLYGHSNRRIADQLFLTEYTVEDHLKRIFAKLTVKSRTALAAKILGWSEQD
jgi:DNA-binding CsgD family transcriptional regulator